MSASHKFFQALMFASLALSIQIVNGQTYGCTDVTACNFNPLATNENNTCSYPQWYIPALSQGAAGPAIQTCIQPPGYIAVNQNCASSVILNDPYCVQTTWDGICQSAFNVCTPSGCTDENACNFDPTAINNDGSCSYGTNPQITSISLANFNCSGGQIIDVIGIDLCGIVSIDILGEILTFTSFSNTHLQCVTPPGAGSADLKITTLAGIATFPISYNPPVFSGIAPLSINCAGGVVISIVGSNLCDAAVLFNGNLLIPTFNSPTVVSFISLPGSGIANVEIITSSGSFQTNITYTAPLIS
ncbi:MAG: IPT/TIG domain-containing protein, partial [Flavobacteriaceae bacterium]|nr:IPT/TIG domain-containing protein [Flavobacteriaceae bacterium]